MRVSKSQWLGLRLAKILWAVSEDNIKGESMKIFLAFVLFMIFGSDVALCQDTAAADAGLGAMLLSFLPVGAGQTIAIIFASMGVMNALSVALGKVASMTNTKTDDAVASKFNAIVTSTQKFLNFFIAKR
jgi:hypothetical protein